MPKNGTDHSMNHPHVRRTNARSRFGLLSACTQRQKTTFRSSAVCIGIPSHLYKQWIVRALLILTLVLSVSPSTAMAKAGDKVDGRKPADLHISAKALPDVSMAAGELVTADGRVLWSRNAGSKRAMASLTKIMTAVVAMENSSPDEIVKVPAEAARVGESTSFLVAGDDITMAELLEGLLVKSGNDAAVAIGEHIAGGEDAFVALMNKRAKELGLSATHFENAHGLDASGHHTSASDLATLSRYAMTKPLFRKIVSERTATVKSVEHSHKVESTNLLLHTYDGANGVKTGWTGDAGYCLAGSAKRNGIELYAIVLGTRSEAQRFTEARELLDWGFAHYRPQQLASPGTVLGTSPVLDYLDATVNGAVSREETIAVFDLAGPIERRVTMASQQAPVSRGDRVGVATFTQAGTVVATVPLVATEDVDKPNVFERVGIGIVRMWRRITGGPLHASTDMSQNRTIAASAQMIGVLST